MVRLSGPALPNLSVYFDAFMLPSWIMLALLCALLCISFGLAYFSYPGTHRWEHFFRPLLYLIQIDGKFEHPRRLSQKMAMLISAGFGYTVYSCYCALLTATMTSSPRYPMVQSFEDIMEHGYETVLMSGTMLDGWFKGFPNASTASRLYHSSVKNNPSAYKSSLEDLKDHLLKNPNSIGISFESSFRSDSRFRVVPEFRPVAV